MQKKRSPISISFSEVRTSLPRIRQDIKRKGRQYLCTHYGVPKALLVAAAKAKEIASLPVKEMGITEFRKKLAIVSMDEDFTHDCILVLTYHDRPTIALLPIAFAKEFGIDLGVFGDG